MFFFVSDFTLKEDPPEAVMKTTVVQWFHWFGEAMTHALGSFDDRHLQPPPIGTQPYRDMPDKRARDY